MKSFFGRNFVCSIHERYRRVKVPGRFADNLTANKPLRALVRVYLVIALVVIVAIVVVYAALYWDVMVVMTGHWILGWNCYIPFE